MRLLNRYFFIFIKRLINIQIINQKIIIKLSIIKTKEIEYFRGSQKLEISGTPEMQSISDRFENFVFKQSIIAQTVS